MSVDVNEHFLFSIQTFLGNPNLKKQYYYVFIISLNVFGGDPFDVMTSALPEYLLLSNVTDGHQKHRI